MAYEHDIDFSQIAPRLGGQQDAFEELCCQLAHRHTAEDAKFVRLRGAGGDGGVECYADLADGMRVGWQAKYVPDVEALIAQAERSLLTALKVHPTLTRYVICFPFDLTGPTQRRGQSGQEKFDAWRKKHEEQAAGLGRRLVIEPWPAFKLRALLLAHDPSGGMRAYFFGRDILSADWFSKHVKQAECIAGARYMRHLDVETDLWEWMEAFGRTRAWSHTYRRRLRACRKACTRFAEATERTASDGLSPAWPDDMRAEGRSLAADLMGLLEKGESLPATQAKEVCQDYVGRCEQLIAGLAELESRLLDELSGRVGRGRVDSPGFRQYMAEYMNSFPTANLDSVRTALGALRDFLEWLCSPAASLAYEHVVVLSGDAGSGKTHGVCATAYRRLDAGLPTCVAFGHQFCGDPDPWARLRDVLELPATLGVDGLLDALSAAGEAARTPLVLFIDAINETRPLRYWHDWLASVAYKVRSRPYVRLCITCRTTYLQFCLPADHGLATAKHNGFAGLERIACQAYFRHYGLEPPIGPILQPELSNPLYLRLVCETLQSRGLRRLPSGWRGLTETINAYLEVKEREFATEHQTSIGARIATGSLVAIARAIADSGGSALPWSEAQRVIIAAKPQAANFQVLEWLVRADLLLEDAPIASVPFGGEAVVRPAFERLGDILLASALIEGCGETDLYGAFRPGGTLYPFLKDLDARESNRGVLAALSILIPEKWPGVELISLVSGEPARDTLLGIVIQSLPSRDPGSFTMSTESLLTEALSRQGLSYAAMDAALATSWQPSAIDAMWLDDLLKGSPFATRDAYWCGYLHERLESAGVVRRLIDAAHELPLCQLDVEVAERWSIVLLWFTAAADRRVKDQATRAAIAILTSVPQVLPGIVQRLLASDDDEVRERALLACYGALIASRDVQVTGIIAEMLQNAFRSEPESYGNGMLRDHIRCISHLAQELAVLPEKCDADLALQSIACEWPPQLPSEDQTQRWADLLHFRPDAFFSDFYKYSMGCLDPWEHAFPRESMARWILQRVARDFGYEGSGCEDYDNYMLAIYGGGRGRRMWAERIGKKYLWIGMYQLASRLCDHVERQRKSWDPEPLIEPLVLLEERKLDPTLPPAIADNERTAPAWWMPASADLGSTQSIADAEWVAREDDTPTLEQILTVVEHNGQRWRVLVSYPEWEARDENASPYSPYRQVWVHVTSYLVPRCQISAAYESLEGRDFFGRWMPEGAQWPYGFAGEYPWAPPFLISPEEWHGRGERDGCEQIEYLPSWDQLVVEWEYDATLPGNRRLIVPARILFTPGDLWWDAHGGYRVVGGSTVLRDPSLTEEGPSSLVADMEDLLGRLKRLDLGLVWTLLGEKWILRTDDPSPTRTFSQVALLNDDGSLRVGRKVFFDN